MPVTHFQFRTAHHTHTQKKHYFKIEKTVCSINALSTWHLVIADP